MSDVTRDRRLLRVMTFNVRRLRDDRDAVVALLRAAEPDVVAVQEPPRGPTGGLRLRRLAGEAGLRVAVAGGGARTTALLVAEGMVVLGTRRVGLPTQVGRTRRGFAVADVEGIRVVAVHLGLDRAERSAHVDRVLRVVTATPGPLVLAGDLNEPPGGPASRSLALHLHDLGATSGPTFPADAPRVRIDVVLGSRGSTADGVLPVDTALARRASDHIPVVVDVLVT